MSPYRRALVLSLMVFAAVGGCARRSHSPPQVAEDAYERSSHQAAQAPEAAAACVMRNAREAGYFAGEQPLYGTAAMAVSVRTFQTGDTLATLSFVGRGSGS